MQLKYLGLLAISRGPFPDTDTDRLRGFEDEGTGRFTVIR
jgi:hypothetical protein